MIIDHQFELRANKTGKAKYLAQTKQRMVVVVKMVNAVLKMHKITREAPRASGWRRPARCKVRTARRIHLHVVFANSFTAARFVIVV